MAHQVFSIPNFRNTAVDLILCNPEDPNSNGVLHYAYTLGAESDAVSKRSIPWAKMQDFAGDYGRQHPETIDRLKNQRGYYPGEGVLESVEGPTDGTDQDTIMRLGALEILANLSSGRLSTTDKDPFPHQLALQQFLRKPGRHEGLRRILIADEVGLGKTIEVGLILRDILLSRGQLEGFRCLYLTSGGLVEDAAEKLRDVLAGTIDDTPLVDTVSSFRSYGAGNTLGVHVASMHAARLYTMENQKSVLPTGTSPQIIIIDECHHAASEGDLAGIEVRREVATQTYLAAKQLLTGEFWSNSKPPELAVLMSATPFRSAAQFVNLLRLLTHGVNRPNETQKFDAIDATIHASELRSVLQDTESAASVVWRRQSDDTVKSWSGQRIFPNLRIVRPHQVPEDDANTPLLAEPSEQFLDLLAEVKLTVARIARKHGPTFGGFATAQLEKKLTSSSVAGACWLFSWAVRHTQWSTQDEFRNDKGEGTEGLRRLIRRISQRIAEYNPQSNAGFATVRFPSDGFEFEAKSLAQSGVVVDIQKYSKALREDAPENGKWLAEQSQLKMLVALGERLLDLHRDDDKKVGAEDAKLRWLNELIRRHPDDRFLLFTESLQTCEALQSALGATCRILVGSMSKSARYQAVADLCNPRMSARILVATSAADEGFDLQVANKVIHWDLSSSPATLMQRNGRVARLGQVSDVTAYYLILVGTHEQRRDDALQAKFASLGIDDEALKNRILGSLTEEQEIELERAIEANEEGIVGDILERATTDNYEMDRQLGEIRTELQYAQVLSRANLANRLGNWQSIGLPDDAVQGIKYKFRSVSWDRPVFGAMATREPVESKVVQIASSETTQELVFDSEFLLFGPKGGDSFKLAGLPPWIKKSNRHGRHRIIPYSNRDLLGTLLQGVARLQRADFLTIPRACFGDVSTSTANARWVLFCTHPLREAENTLPPKSRPFLTYYAFAEPTEGEVPVPIDPEGAKAEDVHDFLDRAEQYALTCAPEGLVNRDDVEQARKVGRILKGWVERETRIGAASFLEEAKYFVPIPVALVRIIPSADHEIARLFKGNEQAIRLAESVFSTISERSDQAFRLSDMDAASMNAGCSPDDALGVLAILASPSVAKLRLDLRTTSRADSPVSPSEFATRLRDWWKNKTVTDEEWKTWAESVEVRWVAADRAREAP